MHRAEVPAGTAVIKQGDVADYFYVVERGQFQVFVYLISFFGISKVY
jgi:CRP-like cAMP-binding protein